MNKRLLRIAPVALVLTSCATMPDGKKQLAPRMALDIYGHGESAKSVNVGRPIYIEARTYPQILGSGDIWTGGVVLINVGRETVSIETMVDESMKEDL